MTSHLCPGGCGSSVPNRLFACRTCWFELPQPMRDAIIGAFGRDDLAHLQACSEARRWFRGARA